MNKEQFLVMSLPHGLYAKRMHFGILKYNSVAYSNEFEVHKDNPARECCLPVCRPLSDLTKDEWIEKLNTFACELLDAAHVYDEKNVIGLNWVTHPFEIVMWLIEHHFDVAGLIEKGEAIDVNTLPENPYIF